MSGIEIVYGNGNADDAMASFPPDDNVLQDSFMAVFTGPESTAELSDAEREEKARAALRKEWNYMFPRARTKNSRKHLCPRITCMPNLRAVTIRS